MSSCDANTTKINAIGYVDAYADATSSVPAVEINAPSAGVLVIPPVIEPRMLNIDNLNTYLPRIKPKIIGTVAIMIP